MNGACWCSSSRVCVFVSTAKSFKSDIQNCMHVCVSSSAIGFRERIDEKIVWKVCTQILLALQECHSRSKNGKVVLHRDLKPANVFLDCDMNVKLGDFGLARVLHQDSNFARTYVGTPYYMSPVRAAAL